MGNRNKGKEGKEEKGNNGLSVKTRWAIGIVVTIFLAVFGGIFGLLLSNQNVLGRLDERTTRMEKDIVDLKTDAEDLKELKTDVAVLKDKIDRIERVVVPQPQAEFKREFVVMVPENKDPFSYYDSTTKVWSGADIDALQKLTDDWGVEGEFVPYKTSDELLNVWQYDLAAMDCTEDTKELLGTDRFNFLTILGSQHCFSIPKTGRGQISANDLNQWLQNNEPFLIKLYEPIITP